MSDLQSCSIDNKTDAKSERANVKVDTTSVELKNICENNNLATEKEKKTISAEINKIDNKDLVKSRKTTIDELRSLYLDGLNYSNIEKILGPCMYVYINMQDSSSIKELVSLNDLYTDTGYLYLVKSQCINATSAAVFRHLVDIKYCKSAGSYAFLVVGLEKNVLDEILRPRYCQKTLNYLESMELYLNQCYESTLDYIMIKRNPGVCRCFDISNNKSNNDILLDLSVSDNIHLVSVYFKIPNELLILVDGSSCCAVTSSQFEKMRSRQVQMNYSCINNILHNT